MSAAPSSHGTDPAPESRAPLTQDGAVPVRPRLRARDRHVLIPLTIFLVFVVLVALLLDGLLIPVGHQTITPGNRPIGAAFQLGKVYAGNCTAPLVDAQNCVAVGNLVYEVLVAASSLTYDSFRLEVELSSGGTLSNTGEAEFSVAEGGLLTAKTMFSPGAGLAMTGGWAVYASGTSASSGLTTDCSIYIDVGQPWSQAPSNLTLTAIGQAGYTGTTSAALTR